jgi:hypothetical protein
MFESFPVHQLAGEIVDYEKERRLIPQAVGCMRGKGDRRTYDAELVVGGVHYVVETGLRTHRGAVEHAMVHVEALSLEIEKTTAKYVARLGFKRARP